MTNNLDAYLEDIGHYLAVGPAREEILSEIRSHILEKAEEERARSGEAALERVIAGFGPPRRVAERYLEGREIIAPAYQRHLFRYTSILFGFHFLFTLIGVIFGRSFVLFPVLFVPRMGVIEALLYLPAAFLTDLGFVALILYFVTQSKKDIKLPWPKFGLEADDIKLPRKPGALAATLAGLTFMLALTAAAVYVFTRHGTVFIAGLASSGEIKPLFTAEAGRSLSLIVIALLAAGAVSLFLKLFTRSRWIDVGSDAVSLILFGLILRRPFDGLFAVPISGQALSGIRIGLAAALLFIVLMTAIALIKNLVMIGRGALVRRPPERGTPA